MLFHNLDKVFINKKVFSQANIALLEKAISYLNIEIKFI